MIREFDTIAAIATGLSEGGIGIIRVSGPDAISGVSSIFVNKNKKHSLVNYDSHTIHYGYITDDNHIIDEVMISIFKAPNSYTKEDVVEINCHGGIVILNQIMNLVLSTGIRMADPGEFTKRAFLNGRIDLSRAEAVMDLISAGNEFAARNSISALRGVIFDQVSALRKDVLYEIAYIESALDDPEHISLEGYQEKLHIKLSDWLTRIDRIIINGRNGKKISSGIRTAIVGKPNAGKSSILNALLRENRAIVTDIEGTTRDTLEENVRIGDISLLLIDTAGIRDSVDKVEKIGIEKSKQEIEKAELVLFVFDSSKELDDNDRQIAMNIPSDKKGIILLNKSDLINDVQIESSVSELVKLLPSFSVIRTSAVSFDGIKELEDKILSLFMGGKIKDCGDEVYMTNLRHIEAMENTRLSLSRVVDSIDHCMPEDFLSIDLNDAYRYLGSIIGEEVSDDVIKEIFSKFCMGK